MGGTAAGSAAMDSIVTGERGSARAQAALAAEQTGPGWYLLQTRAKQEQRAREHLENQGFRCFLPEIDIQTRQGGRLVQRREALFPGYLFVHLCRSGENWAPIRSTRGVLRMVSFSSAGPAPVRAGLVEAIERRLAKPSPVALSLFRHGEKVRITEGAFANVEAIFESFNGEERVVVLLKMLQSEQRVIFPLGSIARLA